MSDLISRQAAIKLIHSLYPSEPIMQMNRKRWKKKYKPYIEVEKALEMFPSAEPLIQCKDCKHIQKWRSEESAKKFGQIYGCARSVLACPKPEDFCSYAERRGEQDGNDLSR